MLKRRKKLSIMFSKAAITVGFGVLSTAADAATRPLLGGTWSNGMTGEQFSTYAPILCDPNTAPLADSQWFHVLEGMFSADPDDDGFARWLHYVVRDGAPTGFRLDDPFEPLELLGEGGLKFNWETAPLYNEDPDMDRREAALGALAPFVNDFGLVDIVRAGRDCNGNIPISYSPGSINDAGMTLDVTDPSLWITEMAFVAACEGPGFDETTPKVFVFWSQRLLDALVEAFPGVVQSSEDMPDVLTKRFCSALVFDTVECPHIPVGPMETFCEMDIEGVMQCNAENPLGGMRNATFTFIERDRVATAYSKP